MMNNLKAWVYHESFGSTLLEGVPRAVLLGLFSRLLGHAQQQIAPKALAYLHF